ncbi:hypothetical protein GC088_02420 [Arthrobacter sp. JZ12]|uniref:WXG100 family type VII secretion target n=1 Tax=Arthrobacter sp. JZ12 TaxID=2654190 RepID=UPI002B49FC49|nr:WXG100 family type VII secretion target [Arthrobacter sp. JZ12]WRH24067.1 hypothetical protein GC088_02420 [Arthrobacter sp. JZ12]
MSQILGMDPGQVRQLAQSLQSTADRLDLLAMEVSGRISVLPWRGGDADAFRSDWSARQRPALATIADCLRQAAVNAAENADAQDLTSSADSLGSGAAGGAGSTGVPHQSAEGNDGGWLTDGWDWAAGGVDWVTEATDDAADWFADRYELGYGNILASYREAYTAMDRLETLADGPPPTLMELAASRILVAGELIDAGLTTVSLGRWAPSFLDDGTAWAGEPIPVSVSQVGTDPAANGHSDSLLPVDLRSIALNTSVAYSDGDVGSTPDGSVRVTRVESPAGPSYIVSIPGTQEWSPFTSGMPADLTGNFVTASGQMSTASEAVALAMAQVGIEPGAPVMLSGHSQGGMIAAALAADPAFMAQYNVTNVMAYGSPIDTTAVPPGVDVISFAHQNDVVPQLDFGGQRIDGTATTPMGVQVTLPDPPAARDLLGKHDHNAYAVSIADAEGDPAGAAAQYARNASTQRFLSGDPRQVESFVVPIERRP